jgi:hypothetical protein
MKDGVMNVDAAKREPSETEQVICYSEEGTPLLVLGGQEKQIPCSLHPETEMYESAAYTIAR